MKPTQNAESPSRSVTTRWTQLVGDDAAGIDGDIKLLIGRLRARYGYTHQMANAELLRRLSFGWNPLRGCTLPTDSRLELSC